MKATARSPSWPGHPRRLSPLIVASLSLWHIALPVSADTVAPADRTDLRPRWIEPIRLESDEANGVAAAGVASDTVTGGAAEAPAPPDSQSREKDWKTAARVVVHGDQSRGRLAKIVAELLKDLGASDVERRVVEDGVTVDQVRFFDVADAAMANEIAAVLEPVFGDVQVRDFTHLEPTPASGLLELWLR